MLLKYLWSLFFRGLPLELRLLACIAAWKSKGDHVSYITVAYIIKIVILMCIFFQKSILYSRGSFLIKI